MKTLFVDSVLDAFTRRQPLISYTQIHTGVSYLSSYLKNLGHPTGLVVLSPTSLRSATARLAEAVQKHKPDVIGFTSVASHYPFIKDLADQAKRRWPSIFQVVGGVHVSLCPDEAAVASFDAICIGEGELPLAELIDSWRKVDGLNR